jgi:hypothetical protein
VGSSWTWSDGVSVTGVDGWRSRRRCSAMKSGGRRKNDLGFGEAGRPGGFDLPIAMPSHRISLDGYDQMRPKVAQAGGQFPGPGLGCSLGAGVSCCEAGRGAMRCGANTKSSDEACRWATGSVAAGPREGQRCVKWT